MESIPVIPTVCANWVQGTTVCTRKGSVQCTACKLVLYCGPRCQKAHWQEHKKACRSTLSKSNWLPAWDRENRAPAWASGAAATKIHNPFGATDKHLWGNVPAIDILQMRQNEGSQYADPSGDLRNVVKTVTSIPEDFAYPVHITINDREFEVVSRNAILLFVAFTSLDDERPIPEIAESRIHIWYSAFLPAGLISSLKSRVSPLISAVCTEIFNREPDALHKHIWTFRSGSTLCLNLQKKEWHRLGQALNIHEGLGFEEARKIRAATVMAPERADYRDRWHYKDITTSMCLAKHRFREDGLLLPFGHPRTGFNLPNPTFFQTPTVWPMNDRSDPLYGWPIGDVNKASSGAILDIYGKLFSYLRDEFGKFLNRLTSVKIEFQLYCLDVKELAPHLDQKTYNRIEVANITDAGSGFVGTATTQRLLSPLLQTRKQNAHATIITSYINATMEMVNMSSKQDQTPDIEAILQYLPQNLETLFLSPEGAAMYRIWDARSFVLDREKFFTRYMLLQRFDAISTAHGVIMERKNTIVEPWPNALKLRFTQKHRKAHRKSLSFFWRPISLDWGDMWSGNEQSRMGGRKRDESIWHSFPSSADVSL